MYRYLLASTLSSYGEMKSPENLQVCARSVTSVIFSTLKKDNSLP